MKHNVPKTSYALAKFLGLSGSYRLMHGSTYHITFVLIEPTDRVQVIWGQYDELLVIDYDSQVDFYSEWEVVLILTNKPS
ncbi:hypothetical protein [Pedobacter sp. V48]|uniref:hypothetical protein n=1 Tax=Pedobacter sp. V48 TaxID=509635 RepID=UPI0003E4BEBC|nr:hypothetical protein [Pedobacter sp. V48]ETZ19173.1 hypothetical protein N824_10555 [Pedobacter sp. V48]